MQTAALWKDDTLSFIHAAMLVPFPALTRSIIIRIVKIPHCQTGIFPPQYMYESTTGRNYIFLLIWKPQGFSAPCRGKKPQIMGIFSEPCCLMGIFSEPCLHHLLDTRDWKEQEFPQSKRQFSPAAYNLFYSPSPDIWQEEQKKVLPFTHGKERSKCASCRGAKMNPLATFFTHTFIQSFNSNTQQNKLYLLRHCLWLNFPCSQLMLQRNTKFSF